MSKCSTGKRMYFSKELAEEALIGAHTAYTYPNGQGPVAVYQCEDCGEYHLTSRGPMNERLSQYIAEGKLKRDKEANQWLGKLKK